MIAVKLKWPIQSRSAMTVAMLKGRSSITVSIAMNERNEIIVM